MPPQRLSSSWFSGHETQRLRMAATAHSTIWRLLCVLIIVSSSGIAPAWRAAVWFSAELAHALARAAPDCSFARMVPVRMLSTSAAIPLTRLSSRLLSGELMHAERRAPAACSCAEGVPVHSSLTSPGIACRTSSFWVGSLAQAFQMAPAASSWPMGVPVKSCWMSSGIPWWLMRSTREASLSTIAFHSAVVAFSCACASPVRRMRSMGSTPPPSWKRSRLPEWSAMALATAAAAASLTRGASERSSGSSASIPPLRLISAFPSPATRSCHCICRREALVIPSSLGPPEPVESSS
mmetsp:Transcript_14120/g.28186  ORF Transcript_14120/g.28186 Transcript_14120/m.28186 type:complete len:295 (-) Transcript_14120:616-1500(-)